MKHEVIDAFQEALWIVPWYATFLPLIFMPLLGLKETFVSEIVHSLSSVFEYCIKPVCIHHATYHAAKSVVNSTFISKTFIKTYGKYVWRLQISTATLDSEVFYLWLW